MVGNRSQCPRCGYMGSIPDGLYDTFGDTLRILATTPRSAASLEHLAAVLRSAQEQGKDREATAATIESEVPEFAGLAGGLRQLKGWSIHEWLSLLLPCLLAFLFRLPTSSTSVTQQQLDQLVHEFVQALPPPDPSPKTAPSPEPVTHSAPLAVRPNDRCPCGSGNRYRHCHGFLGLRGH